MMESSNSTKAQLFYTDFTVAVLIMVTAILVYYGYVVNTVTQSKGRLNEIITDASTISSSLTTSGVPANWDSNTVQRIGLTDNKLRLQQDKLEEFQSIAYNQSRKLFSTRFDFIVFFERQNGTIIPIDNKCAIGRHELITEENGACIKPNVSLLNPKKLVKDTRFVIYNNDIIRMAVYVWE